MFHNMRLSSRLALNRALFHGIHSIFHNHLEDERKRRIKMWKKNKDKENK